MSVLTSCGQDGESASRPGSVTGDSSALRSDEVQDAALRDFAIVPGVRMGSVTANSSEADLITIYGSDVVKPGEVPVGEGQTESGTLIFAGTPDELEILWHDADRRCPNFVTSRAPGSPWSTAGNARVGAPLSVVEQENGVSFEFSGFDWDYQGYVRDWKGGQLLGLMLRFELPADLNEHVSPDSMGRIGGPVIVHSNDPLMRSVRPVVQEIGLGWPRRDQRSAECMQKALHK